MLIINLNIERKTAKTYVNILSHNEDTLSCYSMGSKERWFFQHMPTVPLSYVIICVCVCACARSGVCERYICVFYLADIYSIYIYPYSCTWERYKKQYILHPLLATFYHTLFTAA